MITKKRSAGGVLYRKQNAGVEVYLVKHRQYGLVLPKGGVKESESWAQAAVREVREETGFEVADPTFSLAPSHYTVEKEGKTIVKEVRFFAFEIRDINIKHEMSLDEGEQLEEGDWYDIDKAMNVLAHETEKEVLREVKSKL